MWISQVEGGVATQIDRSPSISKHYGVTSVKLLKFSHMPSLSRLDSWSSLIKTTIDPDDYYYWSWYLHRGSKITIDWSFSEQSERNDVIAYLVKSETGFDYFDSWTATANAFTSLLAKPYSKIYLESTNGELTFEVHEGKQFLLFLLFTFLLLVLFSKLTCTDDFYFVFFLNTRQESLSGYFKYNIDAMYDRREERGNEEQEKKEIET